MYVIFFDKLQSMYYLELKLIFKYKSFLAQWNFCLPQQRSWEYESWAKVAGLLNFLWYKQLGL